MRPDLQEKVDVLDPLVQEFFMKKEELYEKLSEILKVVRHMEDGHRKVRILMEFMEVINNSFHLIRVRFGNSISQQFDKIDLNYEIALLKLVIFNLDFFSNKQLCHLYNNINNRIVSIENQNKALNQTTNTKILSNYRHLIFQEMNSKVKYVVNSIDEIIDKYGVNFTLYVHQLTNKNQFIKDLKVIEKDLEHLSKEDAKDYISCIHEHILPHIIMLFSSKEIEVCYSIISNIIDKFKITKVQRLLRLITTKGDALHDLKIHLNRLQSVKNCILCKTQPVLEYTRPLCRRCYQAHIENFPEKYYPINNSFTTFSEKFDMAYRRYDPQKGYITINIKLPFTSPFTVMDLEATGDINKDRSQFITTMGFLTGSKAKIFQLIDFKKSKQFFKMCKSTAYGLSRPGVAYNYEGSEQIWLRLYTGGWIDIQKYRIEYSEKFKEFKNSLNLEEVSFEWDDVNGSDCLEECLLYQETKDLIHLKKIAYHNFIDLLREYYVGVTDIRVYDYLDGKTWDYLGNKLVAIYSCPICHGDFTSESRRDNHVKVVHKGKSLEKKRSRKITKKYSLD